MDKARLSARKGDQQRVVDKENMPRETGADQREGRREGKRKREKEGGGREGGGRKAGREGGET